MSHRTLSPDALRYDCEKEADRLGVLMRQTLLREFKKRGAVVALSGGIDSSVVAALAVRALGKERVFGLLMPERDSALETLPLSRGLAEHLGIRYTHEDISPVLEAAGCYRRRDEAIRLAVPDYGPGCKSKIVLPPVVEDHRLRLFKVVVQYPDGRTAESQLNLEAYLGIVAASNFKQRTRKMLEYYHADRLNYGVLGTPNRLEYELGFFVKLGDGAADFKPIAHLYKTQVYRMAQFLKLPDAICKRPPTTDTYSLPQSQEEFYFSLPFGKMDLALYGKNNGYAPAEVGPALGLTAAQVEWVYADIEAKRRVAHYLHAPPVLVEAIHCEPEVLAPPPKGAPAKSSALRVGK
jgi:NAD+ synthase